MKGIVFTEFLELVEDKFGLEICDRMLTDVSPQSGGSYTSVGSYDHKELVSLVARLSTLSNVPVPDLIRTFGEHLFGSFVKLYPAFFEGVTDGITFLCQVEDHIHVEVRKLYPDAELPRFDYEKRGDTTRITYRSSRHLGDLAEGLILACLDHFGTECEIERRDGEGEGEEARIHFDLTPVLNRT
ncbi:MAG: heme NO-binding domain-containing protein [Planctomycetota bacterium]